MSSTDRSAILELSAFSASAPKSEKIQVAGRDFYSLSYRQSGKILIETHGESMISEADSITFVPKGLPYTTEVIEDTSMLAVHFKLSNDIDFRNAITLKTNDVGIRLLFEKLVSIAPADARVDLLSMSVFYEILARLEEHMRKANPKQIPDKISRAKRRIERRYFDPSISVESVADDLKISTSYLRREFSLAYGLSPIAFLRALRINHAKHMLESGYLSISEIAKQCGFSSTSYFIQVFHSLVGISPDKYRKGLYDLKD